MKNELTLKLQIEDMGLFDSQINLERSLQQSIKGVKKK